MTAKIKYHHFSPNIKGISRYWAVLLERVTVETADDDRMHVFDEGIYNFVTKKERDAFTSRCNDVKTHKVAYRYNQKPKGNEQ